MERNRHSSSRTTAFSGASTTDSAPTSFPEMEAEDPYLPNLWICDVNLTDDQELVMEHLIAHLNHPRVVALQATANAIYTLMTLQTVPKNYTSSDTWAHPLSSSSIQLRHPAARERLQSLIKKLADLYEAGAEVEKKEWMSSENDGRGTNFSPLAISHAYPCDERDQEVIWHWTSFSLFQARTAASGLHRIIPAATWVLRAAIEDFHPVSIEPKSGKNSSYVWDWGSPTGVMYGGEPGMHMDRWTHWYATFRAIIEKCSKLEEAKLVVHYAQVSMTAMDQVMGVPAFLLENSGTQKSRQYAVAYCHINFLTVTGILGDRTRLNQSDEMKGETTGYRTVEDLMAEGTAGLRPRDSGTSGYGAVGDVAEGFDGLTLEATLYKEEVVLSETTSSKKVDAKTGAVAKGKQVTKSEAFV
ncbi:hypothetical protein QBC32DRAFT_376405 [Pseudoneurospora amorphoporcata]|uniref:Uncharacterized protein n=1 Tax=Pseudoneurospora amorphoporcata TaxID=241081 RepID=A0AAN6P162_9PEZI|nr:hypothetical protein QBC32DRAFT_376405 [Pseudoneurospora amorphoporcata]